ncbi:ABC transporter permease [Dinghuibacter silviterrae]|uniref:ABC-type antimicrobial peptide transport system permease subunit n=1 Tax=Dinghuibacter silviterrae TaxID=1539049 RepID=A0A4R8DT01_9BACT|nr:ABC transporter permease [Dinghuibacter silviterrae]TDX01412.1 ABC-type antimicrobial peptide transport system permease subunit [Dinghuibacter silviterrae]
MLLNYCKIALRRLSRSQVQSVINISGLALGMAIALLIGLWINDELTFDHYHPNHGKIAEVLLSQQGQGHLYIGPTIATPMGNALHDNYKDLFERTALVSWPFDPLLGVNDKHLTATTVWAQPELPEMFTFQMIRGTTAALADPTTLLLSASMAKALFGNADPVNKTVRVFNALDMRVGGVYEDLPRNTTFNTVQVLLSWNSKNNYLNTVTEWNNHGTKQFVQLREGVTDGQATARVRNVPTPFVKEDTEGVYLQPLDKLHFTNEIIDGQPTDMHRQIVWLMGVIGFFVLLLACINFMNLSTARSEKRAREVGIRKTVGTLHRQLVAQFLVESVLVAMIGSVLSILLVQLTLPFFNSIADKAMELPWRSLPFWGMLLGFTLLTGLVAGSYPAFYLSSFKPIKVLKGVFRAGRYASLPRKVLVVLQFTVSLTLIIGTLIVYNQIQFAQNRPLGYDRAGLVTVPINTPDFDQHYPAFRTDLLATGLFENAARASQSMTLFGSNNSLEWTGMDPGQRSIDFRNVTVTPEFGPTIDWKVTAGRDFSRTFPSDSDAMVLNETAARTIGHPHLIGETVKFFGHPYKVIGIVGDMLTNEPYAPIEPALFIERGYTDVITLRIKTGVAMQKALDALSAACKKYNPSSPFIYHINDDEDAHKLAELQRTGQLAAIFAGLAIFISCLGLFGLAAFMAEQRTREISIRKVLGASVLHLWGLLSRDFVRLSAIALLVAFPLAYAGMHWWLERFPLHTALHWWIFAIAGAGMVLLALVTVSGQGLRAAMMNPAKNMRVD